ncbi:MAG TPA: hypothetical protein VFI35_09650 [Actinomycetota bacterium]|nr:hypothetical protein [Actinomycetota bacterium]
MASGRHQNRNGAYLLVPSPRDVWSTADPIRTSPDANARGIEQLVTSAPIQGSRTWPPWVCPATINPYPSAAASGAVSGECITAKPK